MNARPVLTRVYLTGGLTVLALCTGTWTVPGAIAADAFLYVDKQASACSDSGPGSSARPFCTLAKAAATAKGATTVLIAAGTYLEPLIPKYSGTAGAPLVFQAQPGQLVTITGTQYGVYVNTRSYVTVRGLNVTDTTGTGIYVKGSDHVTIDLNHVSYSGQPTDGATARGITINSTADSVISDNLVDHNSDSGIYLGSGSTRDVVLHNRTTANARGYTRAAPGIDIRSVGNSIIANTSWANEDSGVQIRTGGDNSLVADNITYGNGDHGIDVLQAPGCQIIGNTVYRNVTAGINDEGANPGSTGATIKNNISVDNAIDSPRTDGQIRVDKDSTSGTVVDSNLVWVSVPGQYVMVWGSTKYTSYAAYQAASGQEAHGILGDPRWLDREKADFRLAAGSLAVDSADGDAIGEQLTDATGAARYDDPSVANTGLGAGRYDDRGALEFRG